jgi:MFS family permease
MRSVALPIIEKELQIDQARLEWIAAAYTITSVRWVVYLLECQANGIYSLYTNQACSLLVLGQLTELFGRRNVLCIGLLWSLTFTLACGFAKGTLELVIIP